MNFEWLGRQSDRIMDLVGWHVLLSLIPLVIGLVVALPIGLGRLSQSSVASLRGGDGRIALHNPFARALRAPASNSGYQDSGSDEHHRGAHRVHRCSARAGSGRRARFGSAGDGSGSDGDGLPAVSDAVESTVASGSSGDLCRFARRSRLERQSCLTRRTPGYSADRFLVHPGISVAFLHAHHRGYRSLFWCWR